MIPALAGRRQGVRTKKVNKEDASSLTRIEEATLAAMSSTSSNFAFSHPKKPWKYGS